MAIVFQTLQVNDGSSSAATFSGQVQSATVMIQGFSMAYSDGKDHDLLSIDVSADISSMSSAQVVVKGTAQFQDDAGNVASGTLSVVVVADVAD